MSNILNNTNHNKSNEKSNKNNGIHDNQDKKFPVLMILLSIRVHCSGVAKWLRLSISKVVGLSHVGSEPRRRNHLPQVNIELSSPSFRGR